MEEEKSNKLVETLYTLSTRLLLLERQPRRLRKHTELFYLSLSAMYGCNKCYKYHFFKASENGAGLEQLESATYRLASDFPRETFEKYASIVERLGKYE